MLMSTAGMIFDFILIFLKRRLRSKKKYSAKQWVSLANKYQLIDRLRFTLLTLGVIDIFFYCLHQVIHQKPSSLIGSNPMFGFSFFWSLVLVWYNLFAFVDLYIRVHNIEKFRLTNYLEKVDLGFSKKAKNK